MIRGNNVYLIGIGLLAAEMVAQPICADQAADTTGMIPQQRTIASRPKKSSA